MQKIILLYFSLIKFNYGYFRLLCMPEKGIYPAWQTKKYRIRSPPILQDPQIEASKAAAQKWWRIRWKTKWTRWSKKRRQCGVWSSMMTSTEEPIGNRESSGPLKQSPPGIVETKRRKEADCSVWMSYRIGGIGLMSIVEIVWGKSHWANLPTPSWANVLSPSRANLLSPSRGNLLTYFRKTLVNSCSFWKRIIATVRCN